MAIAENVAPTAMQSVLCPSKAYESLNDRLLDLISRFRVLGYALKGGEVKHDEAASVLLDATETLDRFQEDLDSWIEDQNAGRSPRLIADRGAHEGAA